MIKKGWLIIIGICLFLSAWWLMNGNLMFHTDVGRDMYLLKDVVDNKHLTLIGPRSSLKGLFHGPLWIYSNLPAFFIGRGNPIIMAVFWWGLLVISWWLVYKTEKKIVGEMTAMVATLLVASATILNSHVMINSYGTVIIFPIFYYCLWSYLKTKKTKYLGLGLLVAGMMVQLEIVFGLPMLALLVIWSFIDILKTKKWQKIWVYLLTFIPLSTYFLFDLRHGWIQAKAVLGMANGVGGGLKTIGWINVMDWWTALTGNKILAMVVLVLILWVSFLKINKEKNKYDPWWIWMFSIIILWVTMMILKIESVDFYYLPLISAMAMIVAGLRKYLNKIIYGLLIGLILIINIAKATKDTINYSRDVNFQDSASWQSNYEAGKWIVNHCGNDFGYFVYSSDLYGYSLRYTMDYLKTKGELNKKTEVTCLLMGPNSKENNWSRETWKESDVRINKNPTESKLFRNGILVEKYILTKEEQKVEPNQFLIKDIIFR